MLQRPARRGDADVLVAVGVPDHDDLAAAAALEVRAVQVVGEERGHHLRRRLQIVLGLEQRSDVQRHRAVHLEAAPAGQQQDGENVLGALRHADDVRADGGGAVARPAFADRREDREGPRGLVVGRHGRPLAAAERPLQARRPLRARAIEPGGIAEQATHHGAVHQRVLPHVQRRQMETERL